MMEENEREVYMTATDFQRSVGATIDLVRNNKHFIVVTAHGREQIAVIPVEEYRSMLEASRELVRLRVRTLGNQRG
jgi:prevent-host-death family protein